MQDNIYAKVMPQCLELEEAVIGALLVDKSCHAITIPSLNSQAFYLSSHQKIVECLIKMYNTGVDIDMVSLITYANGKGYMDEIGGAGKIIQLNDVVASSVHIESHYQLIKKAYVARSMIKTSSELINDMYDLDYDTMSTTISDHFRESFDLSSMLSKDLGTSKIEVFKEIDQKVVDSAKGMLGIPFTGDHGFDLKLNGAAPGNLIVVAARPGMGKTVFANTIAKNVCIDNSKRMLIWNLEMSSSDLYFKLISGVGDISFGDLTRGRVSVEDPRYKAAKSALYDSGLVIEDRMDMNVNEMCAHITKQHLKNPFDIILIDYLQLIKEVGLKGKSREGEVSNMSRTLKKLAKDLKVPVILLAQLSRKCEERGGLKMPQLSDLRESGAVEQDADKVFFLYRPEMYYFETMDLGRGDESTKDMALFIVGKNRQGTLGKYRSRWVGDRQLFIEERDY